MNYLIYTFFAIFLSFLWLIFFLRKDNNPESKRMILSIFILGGGAALIAGMIQTNIISFFGLSGDKITGIVVFLIYHIAIISFVEEFLKFLTIRFTVINHSEFDEPVDAMIYMIVAALGFAAMENFIYLVRYEGLIGDTVYQYAIYLGFLRFIGATLLHILSSAIIGFFIALSFLKIKMRKLIIIMGILSGTLLHALYNLFIISEKEYNFLLSSFLLVLLSIFVIYYAFWKLKKIKSICEL